jgi:hypothetical protein
MPACIKFAVSKIQHGHRIVFPQAECRFGRNDCEMRSKASRYHLPSQDDPKADEKYCAKQPTKCALLVQGLRLSSVEESSVAPSF